MLSIVTSTAKTAPAFSPGGLYLGGRQSSYPTAHTSKGPCDNFMQLRGVPIRSQVSVRIRFTSPSFPQVMKKSPGMPIYTAPLAVCRRVGSGSLQTACRHGIPTVSTHPAVCADKPTVIVELHEGERPVERDVVPQPTSSDKARAAGSTQAPAARACAESTDASCLEPQVLPKVMHQIPYLASRFLFLLCRIKRSPM